MSNWPNASSLSFAAWGKRAIVMVLKYSCRMFFALLVAVAVASTPTRAATPTISAKTVTADMKRAVATEMLELERMTSSGVMRQVDFVRHLAPTRLRAWHEAATSGVADAQYLCGVCQREGLGTRTNTAAAVQWFRLAANQGHLRAQTELGRAYALGIGVALNHKESVYWLRKAADQGYPGAQIELALAYIWGAGVETNLMEGVRWFRMAAEQDYAIAQRNLGHCYVDGFGVEENPAEAVRWFRKAAEQGYRDAQFLLGGCHARGYGVASNTVQAASWYRKAAEQAHAEAQYMLGLKYANGDGVAKNPSEAFRWYRKAAEQGFVEAQKSLWDCYARGFGVAKNDVEAMFWRGKALENGSAKEQFIHALFQKDAAERFRWCKKAAEQGLAEAQYMLGECYADGYGVKQNLTEAVQWFRKAAEQGLADAQCYLGTCYRMGTGVAKDALQGILWITKSANQGLALAQMKLGTELISGEIFPENWADAVRWWTKAADQGVADGHAMLALSYEGGKGVVQNDAQACVHWLIASALGNFLVSEVFPSTDIEASLSNVRDRLSPAQYASAQRAAAKWVSDFRAHKGEKGNEPRTPAVPPTAGIVAGTGSGFIISADGYFLTCAHVIEGGREIAVRIGDITHAARIIRSDTRNDVALLKLEGKDFHPLPLARSIPKMGDKVFTVGFPNPGIQGVAAKYTDGAISALSGILDDVRTFQITAPVQGGNSGGALADAAGNAVGLVVAQLNAISVFEYTGTIPQNVNFAVKIHYALPLIEVVPGLGRRLPQPGKAALSTYPVKAVEAATGLVTVYQ